MKAHSLYTPSPNVSAVRAHSLITPPAGCVIPTWTVTRFYWFNSSHNLNCFSGPDLNATGCIDNRQKWCDPSVDANCTQCNIGLCSSGSNIQPAGYGPPDIITIKIGNDTLCSDVNPKAYRRVDIGHGRVECAGSVQALEFYGSSNKELNVGHIDFHSPYQRFPCQDGNSVRYSGSVDFLYACTHDEGFNATCRAEPFNIPITNWTMLNNASSIIGSGKLI